MPRSSQPKIDKNVHYQKNKRRQSYGFDRMEVGDSIFFTGRYASSNARSGAAKHKIRHPGWEYDYTLEGDGFRIWRTA